MSIVRKAFPVPQKVFWVIVLVLGAIPHLVANRGYYSAGLIGSALAGAFYISLMISDPAFAIFIGCLLAVAIILVLAQWLYARICGPER